MSAIAHPERDRCIVSIAGATDLDDLADDMEHYTIERSVREQLGRDADARRRGSPLQRVDELDVPVLLCHGEDDLHVFVEHSQQLAKAGRKAKKEIELVEYEATEHSPDRNAVRIDMLARMGRLLESNLSTKPAGEDR